MTSTATLNDQALPSIAAERCAKTRNASLATQKKSRCRWCFFSSCPWILFTRLPSFRVWLSDCAHKHCTLMGRPGTKRIDFAPVLRKSYHPNLCVRPLPFHVCKLSRLYPRVRRG